MNTVRASVALSHRINAERIVLVGWMRALLLQIAHPLIAAAVRDHSSFRASTADSCKRLRHTVHAMLAITFGAPAAREQSLDAIRAIHRRVHGTLSTRCGIFPAGTPYSAEDSDLLVWVHATLAESIVLVYDAVVAPLSQADRDCYCAASADVAIELGARRDAVPRSWEAVRAHVADGCASGRVAVGADARELASALFAPVRLPFVRHILTPLVSVLAAGLLPATVRQQYGLAWDHRRARRFGRALQLLRLMRRVAPAGIAHWSCARSLACYEVNHGYFAAPR